MALTLRPFRDEDRSTIVEIHNRILPDEPLSAERMTYADSIWDSGRYTRLRMVTEDPAGLVVAWGQIAHSPWRFHPRQFYLRLEVDPAHQRRGIGSAFLDRLLAEIRGRNALLVRTDVAESLIDGVRFLTRRGFRE